MGALSNHVAMSISQNSVGVSRLGFGVAGILSHNASFVPRTKSYSSSAEVLADGFAASSPEYLCAQALFSQSKRPKTIKILRAALKPTQVYVITPVAANSTEYAIEVVGEGVTSEEVSFTSDASGTVAEICTGLTTALNAVVGRNYTAVDGVTAVTVTATAAGDWFSLAAMDIALLDMAQTHVDPGVATDLAAINVADPDWYGLITLYNSNALVLAAAAWAESNAKLYAAGVSESAAAETAAGNSDTLDDLATLNRARTIPVWHWSPAEFLEAGWLGEMLPTDAGTATWKFKQVSGARVRNLSSTQRANLIARSANFFETVKGRDSMSEGTTADGDFIDTQRGLDWLEDDVGSTVYENMAAGPKLGMTDSGIASVTGGVRASMERGVSRNFLASSPAPIVTAPLAADISAADRLARHLDGVAFSATLAGAIHKTTIIGSVS